MWDTVSDGLVEVFQAGGPLLKQIIHGGLSYDDPIEVTTKTATGDVQRLYPLYDEAATGSLQAALDPNGRIVARNLSNDPYGAEDLDTAGAAVRSRSTRPRAAAVLLRVWT